MKKNHILLGVTGSIAAYKAAELVRVFRKDSCDVQVVMTDSATNFIGPLTLSTLSQNPVHIEMFGEISDWKPEHISLAGWADLYVVAPCTANVIAKLAHGIADDLLTATALATKAPLIIAPAMNEAMWDSRATQDNVATIKTRGVDFIDVADGDLACGCEGMGRLADVETIRKVVIERLAH